MRPDGIRIGDEGGYSITVEPSFSEDGRWDVTVWMSYTGAPIRPSIGDRDRFRAKVADLSCPSCEAALDEVETVAARRLSGGDLVASTPEED